MATKRLRGGGSTDLDPFDDAGDDAGIVAFDFDGTLTVTDTFTHFLKWRTSRGRHALGMLRLAPAALAYLVHRNRGKIKAAAAREFLGGMSREQLEAEIRTYAEAEAVNLLRPDALRAWRWWRSRRSKLVIVSASPDILVAPFARGLGADVLIATELAYDPQDRVTGDFATPNCRGKEKVRRLQAKFGADVRLKAAYGDTSGDREMLQIADHPGYREFRERP